MLATFRIHKTDNYFVCPNGFLKDKHISWRAKGILAYLLSKPDDWTVQIKDVVRNAIEGDKATRSAILELLKHKYMSKRVIREDGKYARFEYDVYESPELNKTSYQYLVSAPFSQNGEMVKHRTRINEEYEQILKLDVETAGLSWTGEMKED